MQVQTRVASSGRYQHLTLKCHKMLSNFALNFNLRPYIMGLIETNAEREEAEAGGFLRTGTRQTLTLFLLICASV